jgi:hypothetical protein
MEGQTREEKSEAKECFHALPLSANRRQNNARHVSPEQTIYNSQMSL